MYAIPRYAPESGTEFHTETRNLSLNKTNCLNIHGLPHGKTDAAYLTSFSQNYATYGRACLDEPEVEECRGKTVPSD